MRLNGYLTKKHTGQQMSMCLKVVVTLKRNTYTVSDEIIHLVDEGNVLWFVEPAPIREEGSDAKVMKFAGYGKTPFRQNKSIIIYLNFAGMRENLVKMGVKLIKRALLDEIQLEAEKLETRRLRALGLIGD